MDRKYADKAAGAQAQHQPQSMTPTEQDEPGGQMGKVSIAPSLLERAKADDKDAILTMFKQFMPADEEVHFARYLGIEGFWILGTHSFGCLTNRRIATIRTGSFGEVVYQDGYLEYINSAAVYQPSKLLLYVAIAVLLLAAIPTFGISLLLLPLVPKAYYRSKKCGVVFVVREGLSIYLFTNRNRLVLANRLQRACTDLRDKRAKDFRPEF